jgi:hypothetical protein
MDSKERKSMSSDQIFLPSLAKALCEHLESTKRDLEAGCSIALAAIRIQSVINCFRPEFRTGNDPLNENITLDDLSSLALTGVGVYNPEMPENVITVYSTLEDWKRDSGQVLPLPGKWELWNFRMIGESRVGIPVETKKKLFT